MHVQDFLNSELLLIIVCASVSKSNNMQLVMKIILCF
jgi:hypothetical protein